MIIDKNKTYRTRNGREVRIYATDGTLNSRPRVHGAFKSGSGWRMATWTEKGRYFTSGSPHHLDLIEADPHGIIPRHRELLAEAYKQVGCVNAEEVFEKPFSALASWNQAALIALARLDAADAPPPAPERPQIGDPGFEWQVGMVCQTRSGELRRVRHVGTEGTYLVHAGPVHGYAFTTLYTVNGHYNVRVTGEDDLVRVVEWPDGRVE